MKAAAAVGALLLGLLAAAGTGAQTASAHDWLVSSTPAAGEQLDSGPAEVTLVFSDELLDLGDEVVVADPSGRDWSAGEPRVAGRELSVPLEAGLPESAYLVRWRVVSADGHPVTGVIPFTVGAAAAWAASPQASGRPPVGIHAVAAVNSPGITARVAAAGLGAATVVVIGFTAVRSGFRRRRGRVRAAGNGDENTIRSERERKT